MAETFYTLLCYVEGDNTLFPVTASSTASIGGLKNTIKVAKNNFLQRFDASNLTLFKVSYIMISM
jgi:hypothetical protein